MYVASEIFLYLLPNFILKSIPESAKSQIKLNKVYPSGPAKVTASSGVYTRCHSRCLFQSV